MTYKQPVKTEKKEEQKPVYEVQAWINHKNEYDTVNKKFTDKVSDKVLIVRTHDERPETIGYINIQTLEKFLNGEVNGVPITKRVK